MNILDLSGVTKSFTNPDGSGRTVVLDGVDMSVRQGETLAITGPSGSGKTTLLNIIGTLDRSSSGSVRLDGQELTALDSKQGAIIRNQQIGFIFQMHHLLAQCSSLENVLLPTLVNSSGRVAVQRAKQLLRRVGLGDKLNSKPGQLSAGQRQRIAVVRAMINRPKLLLADEPTGSLDRENSDTLADLLVELNVEDKIALVVVTHSQRLADRMDKVMVLNNGLLK